MATRGDGRQLLGYAWRRTTVWRTSISTLTRRVPDITLRNTAIWNDWFDLNVSALTVADAAQAQAADSPTLTQHFVLQVADVEMPQSADELTLTAHEPTQPKKKGGARIVQQEEPVNDEDEVIALLFIAAIIANRRLAQRMKNE